MKLLSAMGDRRMVCSLLLRLWLLFISISSGNLFQIVSASGYPGDSPNAAGFDQQLDDSGLLSYYLVNGLDGKQQPAMLEVDGLTGEQLANDNNGFAYFAQPLSNGQYQVLSSDQPEPEEGLVDFVRQLQSGDQIRFEGDLPAVAYQSQSSRNKKLTGLGFAPNEQLTITDYISAPVNSLEEYNLRQRNLSEPSKQRVLQTYVSNILKKLDDEQQPRHIASSLYTNSDDDNNEDNALNEALQVDSGADNSPRYGSGEYIDNPLALIGHQYVQGGAGEGRQLLGPEGTFENVQVVKTDHGVPSYCNPPNPCPIGYTAEDGCLEKFVNSASFSREYQAKQKCSCDNEHSLFNCAAAPINNDNSNSDKQAAEPLNSLASSNELELATQADPMDLLRPTATTANNQQVAQDEVDQSAASNKLNVLARTIENRFGNLASVRNLISKSALANSAGNDDFGDDHPMIINKKSI